MEHHDTGLEHEAETVRFIIFVWIFGLLILFVLLCWMFCGIFLRLVYWETSCLKRIFYFHCTNDINTSIVQKLDLMIPGPIVIFLGDSALSAHHQVPHGEIKLWQKLVQIINFCSLESQKAFKGITAIQAYVENNETVLFWHCCHSF